MNVLARMECSVLSPAKPDIDQVFTNTIEDVKPHFLGLSKILEINGFEGIPIMLAET